MKICFGLGALTKGLQYGFTYVILYVINSFEHLFGPHYLQDFWINGIETFVTFGRFLKFHQKWGTNVWWEFGRAKVKLY